jgi:hypothetical protein
VGKGDSLVHDSLTLNSYENSSSFHTHQNKVQDFFLKSKRKFWIRTEEPGRTKKHLKGKKLE